MQSEVGAAKAFESETQILTQELSTQRMRHAQGSTKIAKKE